MKVAFVTASFLALGVLSTAQGPIVPLHGAEQRRVRRAHPGSGGGRVLAKAHAAEEPKHKSEKKSKSHKTEKSKSAKSENSAERSNRLNCPAAESAAGADYCCGVYGGVAWWQDAPCARSSADCTARCAASSTSDGASNRSNRNGQSGGEGCDGNDDVESDGCGWGSVTGNCRLTVTNCNGVFYFQSVSGNGKMIVPKSVSSVSGNDVSGSG